MRGATKYNITKNETFREKKELEQIAQKLQMKLLILIWKHIINFREDTRTYLRKMCREQRSLLTMI